MEARGHLLEFLWPGGTDPTGPGGKAVLVQSCNVEEEMTVSRQILTGDGPRRSSAIGAENVCRP